MDSSEAKQLVKAANDRLKAAGTRVKLQILGKADWLYLRGTFPPKPGDGDRDKQYRIALGVRAIDKKAIKEAELQAKQIDVDLNLGRFNWRGFSRYAEPQAKVAVLGNLLEIVEQQWWQQNSRNNPSNVATWNVYKCCFRSLPKEAAISVEAIADWITENSDSNQPMRRHYVHCGKLLLNAANLPIDTLKSLTKQIPSKPVNPRSLPSDKEIAKIRDGIREPGWQYIYSLMACYGLRNHEVFFTDLSEFPNLKIVGGKTKTGDRTIPPFYPEWAEQWELNKPIMPAGIELNLAVGNQVLGAKVLNGFRNNGLGKPYNLRHCYARRCLEFGIPSDVGAYYMGHSTITHEQKYRAWIGDRAYLNRAKKAAEQSDRPIAP